jgi:hypothetical protein
MADEKPLKKREFAVQHRDGSVSDIELWGDILSDEDVAEIEAIKAKRKAEAEAE